MIERSHSSCNITSSITRTERCLGIWVLGRITLVTSSPSSFTKQQHHSNGGSKSKSPETPSIAHPQRQSPFTGLVHEDCCTRQCQVRKKPQLFARSFPLHCITFILHKLNYVMCFDLFDRHSLRMIDTRLLRKDTLSSVIIGVVPRRSEKEVSCIKLFYFYFNFCPANIRFYVVS